LIALVVLISLVGVMAIGVWSRGRIRTSRDFFIAGQDVGLWPVAMATMATAFSGFVFLGGPGLTYRMGVASFAIILPIGFTASLLCWTVARPLRLLSEIREILTIPDAIACRFEDRLSTALATLAVFIGVIAYLGAQFLALAILLETLFDGRDSLGSWSLPVALLAGASIVVLYSVLGGMVAGVYTDLVQGLLMLLAALLVFGRALWVNQGPVAMLSSIGRHEAFADFFDPFANGAGLTTLSFFLVFGIGVLGQPHMLHKFYMLRDPRQLRWFPLVLGSSQVICLLIWVGIGLAVPALVAQGRMATLAHPDEAAPRFLLEFCPPLMTGVAVSAVLAAIMSTADSFLNIGSGVLVRDLPRLLGGTKMRGLRSARWATAGIALLAAALALGFGDLIALLGTFAFGTLGAALAPTFVLGLSWSRVTASAASASIASGLVVSLGLEALRRMTPSGTLEEIGLAAGAVPSAIALMVSFSVLLTVSWVTGRDNRSRIPSDVLKVMESG
jgi:SSS family transporter